MNGILGSQCHGIALKTWASSAKSDISRGRFWFVRQALVISETCGKIRMDEVHTPLQLGRRTLLAVLFQV
jgi:hypothetical protein